MILGITLFAAITGTITSRLVTHERATDDPARVAARLRALDGLRDSGLLHAGQYERKRAEIIDGL